MRIEIISGSARSGGLTKRIALHLHKELHQYNDLEVGLIDLSNHTFTPVQNVYSSPTEALADDREMAHRIFEADAFVLVTPEYNGSYSPALKNFLDHFPKQSEKVFGIATGSPGSFGGMRAALQLQTLIYGLMGIGSPQMLVVPELDTKFREDGTLVNEQFQQSVNSFIDRFLWLARAIAYSSTKNLIKKSA